MKNFISLESSSRENNALKFHFSSSLNLFTQTCFYIQYDRTLPSDKCSVNAIPFAALMAPICAATGADMILPELDLEFSRTIKRCIIYWKKCFPRWSFDFDIRAKLVENHSSGISDAQGMLFSGGLDSLCTYLRHRPMITNVFVILGADIPAQNANFIKLCKEKIFDPFANSERIDLSYISTDAKSILDKSKLEKYAPDWYGTVQFSLLLTSLTAPLSHTVVKKLWLAGCSHRIDYRFPCAGDPELIRDIRWCDTEVKDDSNEISRAAKLTRYLKPHKDFYRYLRVCWSQFNAINCGKCEKCYRTICELLVSNIDPNEANFEINRQSLQVLKARLKNYHLFFRGKNAVLDYWRDIQKSINLENLEDIHGSRDFLEWLSRFERIKQNHSMFSVKVGIICELLSNPEELFPRVKKFITTNLLRRISKHGRPKEYEPHYQMRPSQKSGVINRYDDRLGRTNTALSMPDDPIREAAGLRSLRRAVEIPEAKRIGTFTTARELKAELQAALAQLPPFENCSVLDCPHFFNVGDHLIWLGLLTWLRNVRNAGITYISNNHSFSQKSFEKTSRGNPIVFTGGGNLGDLWPDHQNFRERIISQYHDCPVVIMPQSIYFKEKIPLRKAQNIFNAHPDLTLFCRDFVSYEKAKLYFPRCRVLIAPDMTFQLADWIASLPLPEARSPALFLGRNDRETNPVSSQPKTAASIAGIVEADWPGMASKTKWRQKIFRRLPFLWRTASVRELVAREPALWSEPIKNLARDLSVLYFPSAYLRSLDLALQGIRHLMPFHFIMTNRLHAHILSVLMGKPNALLPNSYHKNQSFYTTWTQGIPFAHFTQDASFPTAESSESPGSPASVITDNNPPPAVERAGPSINKSPHRLSGTRLKILGRNTSTGQNRALGAMREVFP